MLAAETDKNLSVKEKSFSKIGFRKKKNNFVVQTIIKTCTAKLRKNLLFYENLLFKAAVN